MNPTSEDAPRQGEPSSGTPVQANGRAKTKPARIVVEAENEPAVAAPFDGLQLPGGHAPLTDLGNAERLAKEYGRDVKWVELWSKFIAWGGSRWSPASRQAVTETAAAVVRSLGCTARDAARQLQDRELSEKEEALLAFLKRVAAHAHSCESAKRLNAMVALLPSCHGQRIGHELLDGDHWLLNCPNGTVDLRTGQIRPHRREDYCTKLCPTPFRPRAACPAWEATLLAIFGGKVELADYFRRLCGYFLTGDVSEQVLPIFHGDGSNGKSLVLKVLLGVFGKDYAGPGSDELMSSRAQEIHPTFKADLFGKRLVTLSETREGGRIPEALVKQLTGGDAIKARKMREDLFEFPPTHKLVICTNYKPEVRGTDHGVWRRLRLVPFVVRFWKEEDGETGPEHLRADRTLADRLLGDEAAGVLAWAVRGCLEWQRGGLCDPPEVRTATAEYRAEQDVIAAFLGECCDLGQNRLCRAGVLYSTYTSWHKRSGEAGDPLSLRRFGDKMRRDGIVKETSNGVWYRGVDVRLTAQDDGERFPL